MKYIGMPIGMWALFAHSFRKQLTAVLGYNIDTAKAITKKAKTKYKARTSRFLSTLRFLFGGEVQTSLNILIIHTRKQQEALNTLLEQDEVLISQAQLLSVSDATAQDILKNLPDTLSAERKKVIKVACSLVGKVNYFWGGKSSVIGWDSKWGKLKTVSAEGSKTTGTKRPFGLDCSGFVTWSFINSGFNASAIGHGTQGQIAKCSRISWSNAQAGDLAFYGDLSHVGIIAGKDADGNILVIHSSSGRNNVVITTNSGFGFAAGPGCYKKTQDSDEHFNMPFAVCMKEPHNRELFSAVWLCYYFSCA